MKYISSALNRQVANVLKTSIRLTKVESCLFGILWERRASVVPVSDLIDAMDALHENNTHTEYDVRVYVCRLRRKFKGIVDIGTFPKRGYAIINIEQ